MKRFVSVAVLLTVGSLIGCADPNTAIFVTNSSLGINFDSKPATANIAYDRVEAFIAPRTGNGGTPPVASSFETGGSIFSPIVRQSYATGAAAVKATKGPTAADGPSELSGDPNQKKLMFFGTTTTIGLKVGFATAGAIPDSLMFGYNRKEASIIPLGAKTEGDKTTAVYPSVVASIDMNTTTTDPTSTGITSKQFFATGEAAEGLVMNNPTIAAAFAIKAENAALAGLTPDELAKAKAAGIKTASTAKDQLAKITDFVTAADGSLNQTKVTQIVQAARLKNAKAIPVGLENNNSTVGVFRDRITPLPTTIQTLYDALPTSSGG
jgi:hypothetical protein